MKFFGSLALAFGLVAAVSPAPQGAAPNKARIPLPAPLKDIMTMAEPSIMRDVSGLSSLPEGLATKRQLSKQDFYECQVSVS